MFSDNNQKLEDVLLQRGIISKDLYDKFKIGSKEISLDNFVLINNILDEESYTKIKAEYAGIPYKDLTGEKIDYDILHIIPQEVAENYKIICFKADSDKIDVGLIEPDNFKAKDAIEFLAKEKNFKIEYFYISENSFNIGIKQYKTLKKEVNQLLDIADEEHATEEKAKQKEEAEGIEEVIKGAPVSKMVSVILRHAVEGGASDIHIEPSGDKTRVRYRIDGMLGTSLILPSYIHSTVVARIKILSNLKIDESRIPQDGRMRLIIDNKTIDFRVSTIPLTGKEKVVMRILDTSGKTFTLSQLGFTEKQVKVIEKNIHKPNGMALVTGPTGSGKSTTLYSVLHILNRESVNIITLEDPVEYTMDGINQSQVNPAIHYNFSTGLRAILRQDPDVIMVGEIRDNETAELAIHAALTGHCVLSTLHTNDALGAIPRLIDMQVEPFLLSSTVNVIIAQRLVRKICDFCKEEVTIPPVLEAEVREILKDVPLGDIPSNINMNNKIIFYKGKGCSKCGNTGYKGRSVISEVVDINDELKQFISEGFKDMKGVKEALKRQALIFIKIDGYIKALEGKTTLEEIIRVTKE